VSRRKQERIEESIQLVGASRSSFRISSGRCVPGRQKVADAGTQSLCSAYDKVLGEKQEASLNNFFSSPLEVGFYVAIGSQIARLYQRDKWIVADLH